MIGYLRRRRRFYRMRFPVGMGNTGVPRSRGNRGQTASENSTPVLGGSMLIGNRLGGLVTGTIVVLAVTAGASAADRVTTIPLGGSLENQSGEHPYGVYVP